MEQDSIEIRGLELLVYCGTLPEEKVRKQVIQLDLDLYADLNQAAISDDVSDTVNYGTVIEVIEELISNKKYNLLENLANQIATKILDRFEVAEITVKARKLNPPLPNNVNTVGVSLHRRLSN